MRLIFIHDHGGLAVVVHVGWTSNLVIPRLPFAVDAHLSLFAVGLLSSNISDEIGGLLPALEQLVKCFIRKFSGI